VPRNDEGEFELILGNRQLLSVFFIIVILLGVFFTMGYIVGRNSAPAEVASSGKEAVASSVDSNAARSASAEKPSSAVPEAPAASSPAGSTEESAKSESAGKDSSEAAAVDAKPAPKTGESPKPVPVKEEPARKKEKATRAAAEPVAGQAYLQLAATSKHEADIMVDVLRNKGFKALAAEIEEKPGTFRVLVGPIAEGATNKIRADLQNSGFPGNAAIRRVF
jgi:cell division septation protein DedD